jgi:hypothetical protein
MKRSEGRVARASGPTCNESLLKGFGCTRVSEDRFTYGTDLALSRQPGEKSEEVT